MKQFLIPLLLFSIFSVNLFAQKMDAIPSGVPQGMKYQAVARGISGEILAEKTVGLKINLGSKTTNIYSEIHNASTNSLGLFDLAIGSGKVISGKFDQIPWASEEIWISILIDAAGNGDYKLANSSKLLAVPYAFHAGTAGEISQHLTPSGGAEACPAGAAVGTLWSIATNCNTPANAKFGTADFKPIVFVTDFTERMRIAADGNVNINRSLNIGENLTVSGLIRFLNTTGSTSCTDGSAVVSGGFSVAKRANICGDTRIFSTTGTTGASNAGGALFVDGGASIGSLNVRGGRSGSDCDFNSYPWQAELRRLHDTRAKRE